jgi:hypothetical protein
MIIQGMSHPLHGVASLPYLGVIRVLGEDAAKFLQGQLTQDFALLGPAEARLAAFCNAKGRMQASFIGWRRAPDEILLVCSRDVLPATLKRLSMFVLRAKAKLSDASGEFTLFGLAGETGGGAPWSLTREGEACRIQLYPADGQSRALWVAPPARGARRPSWGVAMGRRCAWHAMITAPSSKPRAADAQLRVGRRCQLQEGLLPGPGGRPQPVPRHAPAFIATESELAAGQEVTADAEQPVASGRGGSGSRAAAGTRSFPCNCQSRKGPPVRPACRRAGAETAALPYLRWPTSRSQPLAVGRGH